MIIILNNHVECDYKIAHLERTLSAYDILRDSKMEDATDKTNCYGLCYFHSTQRQNSHLNTVMRKQCKFLLSKK